MTADAAPRAPWAARAGTSSTVAAGALLVATVAALVWANAAGPSYAAFWHLPVAVSVGDATLALDLRHWVNDALMALFFFLVSLEAKRELVLGGLRDRRRAGVPVVAALVGLVVPAALYVAVVRWGGAPAEAAGAWGVVISTDTAFALGLLAVVGRRAPAALRLFLLTLAVVDDIGALLVVAVVYTEELRPLPLLAAVAAVAVIAAFRRLRVWRGPAYLLLAVLAWLAVLGSGVHATLAGVAIGLAVPVYPPHRGKVESAAAAARRFARSPTPRRGRAAALGITRAVSVNERLHTLFTPAVNLLVVPVFALANAGVAVDAAALRSAAGSPVTWAVVAGLVGGKLVGVAGGTGLAVALRLGRPADGLAPRHVVAGGLVSGVGFTISLFIVDLALDDPQLQSEARIGVLAASLLAAGLAAAGFGVAARRDRGHPAEATRLVRPVRPGRDHTRGDVRAQAQLVVYASFVFTDAGRAVETVDELRDELGDRLLVVFRHLPTGDPVALAAAEAAEEAAAQGRFWPMHDALAARSGRLTAREIRRCAADAGMNLDRLEDALRDGRHRPRVAEDVADARAMRVAGPPGVFVDGVRYTGAVDVDDLRAALPARGTADGRPLAATTPT